MQDKPLAGFRVIDFSAVFAGPLCTRYLRDCGAEVIKIEPPKVGDMTRGSSGNNRVFASFNAGKQSIAIDLKQGKGQELARELIRTADILVENFRPGIMARFGLDYASLAAENPELVYCSISGFGQSGPLVDRAAYAPVIHAVSGFDAVFAAAQDGDETRPPNWDIMVADILTGTFAFGAVQTALLGRLRHGRGDYIDVSMMDVVMSLIPAHIQRAQETTDQTPIGRYCPVQTRDGYVMMVAVSDKNLKGVADVLKRPELLNDPRFVGAVRRGHMRELGEEVEKWSLQLTSSECETALNAAGVPCAGYLQPEDLFSHPQVVERQSFTELHDDALGDFLIQNIPMQVARRAIRASDWVADLGQHTDEVLAERLGLGEQEISFLREQGVVA